jgi:hypothetical protein
MIFALCATTPSEAQDLRGERTCWHGVGDAAPWSLCFDGQGGLETSIYYPPMELGDGTVSMGEGLGTGGRYWIAGTTINFETTLDWLSEAWPWHWTMVTCELGGDHGEIELSQCGGSGASYGPAFSTARHSEPDLVFRYDHQLVNHPTP